MTAHHVVAVVAHPDDEAWAIGGTLALLARCGHRVTVLAATSGEGGWIHGKRGVPDAATIREAELAASCEVLGANRPEFMGWSDGALAILDTDQAVSELAARLEALAPDVVIGLGPDGGYGHIDHTVLCRLVRAAVPGLVAPSSGGAVVLLEAAFAPDQLAPVRATIARFARKLLDPAAVRLGHAPEATDVTIDIRPVAAVKQAALRRHASQLPREGPLAFLGGAVAELLAAERFRRVHGAPAAWLTNLSAPSRVLHVTRDLAPRVNGGISVAVDALIRSETAPVVVSFDGWRAHRRDGAQQQPVRDTRHDATVLRINHPDHLAEARRFALEAQPSAIVVHHAMLWPFAAELAATCALPAPDLFVHVLQADLDALRGLDAPTASLRAEQVAVAAASRVVVPSAACASAVAMRYPSARARIVVRDLKPDVLAALPTVANRTATFDLPDEFVLYAGRFADIKGTADLFEAIPAVLAAAPRVEFVIAGGVPDNPKSERRWLKRWRATWPPEAAERAHFVGWPTREALLDAMQRAAVVVIPSRVESFGLVALEAAAVRARIVASDLPALRETLGASQHVRWVPAADSEALASAIVATLRQQPPGDSA